MARPLSEEKRELILAAATEMVAKLGTSASTAKIAKEAGLGEGTLFTYFKTKDELLNQVLFAVEMDLAKAISPTSKVLNDSRSKIECIWNSLIEWGVRNPSKRSAMKQLIVSDRISAESRQFCKSLFQDTIKVIEENLVGKIDPARASFYIDTIMMGLADLTIEAIAVNPNQKDLLKLAGFDLFWKGVAV